MKNRPQVILLGNGLNRAYGGTSWDKLLKNITKREDLKKYLENQKNKLKSPMPLQAILVTDDNVGGELKKYKHDAFGQINEPAHEESLKKILLMGADHIITTNYSYELEFAANPKLQYLKPGTIEKKIAAMQTHTEYKKYTHRQYSLSTFNKVEYEGTVNNVWHIHGEARKHSSMVLGHYYYGNLLSEITKYNQKNRNRYEFCQKKDKELHIKSWIDAFIMGDVYVLGFGLDLSEIDIWWLLNRKKRENAEHGDLYFYEPIKVNAPEIDERLKLIGIFAHKDDGIQNMGVTIPVEDGKKKDAAYREFYEKAIIDIANRIKKNGGKI